MDDFDTCEVVSKMSCAWGTADLPSPRLFFLPVECRAVERTIEACWLFTEVLLRLLKLLLKMLLVSTAIRWGAAYSSAAGGCSPSSLVYDPASI